METEDEQSKCWFLSKTDKSLSRKLCLGWGVADNKHHKSGPTTGFDKLECINKMDRLFNYSLQKQMRKKYRKLTKKYVTNNI